MCPGLFIKTKPAILLTESDILSGEEVPTELFCLPSEIGPTRNEIISSLKDTANSNYLFLSTPIFRKSKLIRVFAGSVQNFVGWSGSLMLIYVPVIPLPRMKLALYDLFRICMYVLRTSDKWSLHKMLYDWFLSQSRSEHILREELLIVMLMLEFVFPNCENICLKNKI